MSKWIIVYSQGNRSLITPVEICQGLEYEISDYAVASRKVFYSEEEANDYCRRLAKKNDIKAECTLPDFLD